MQLADKVVRVYCSLTESMETVVYGYEEKMLRSDYIDAKADLDLRCSHMT